ncbi:outer membrane protein assembly factor BamE [Pseudomonas batumici]|uniref:outer membrane protein assembly factor BamE domain-containing protein n=1 Tax=Pseudomonas batumici TaxID=226910 RepID=UPI0030D46E61
MPSHTKNIGSVSNRILLLTVLAVLVVPIIGFCISSFLEPNPDQAFEQVQMGATQQQVVALLGTPSVVRACGETLWWGSDADYRGKNDGRCVTEERYEYFLSAWGIGYSQDGHVVSKYHYISE